MPVVKIRGGYRDTFLRGGHFFESIKWINFIFFHYRGAERITTARAGRGPLLDQFSTPWPYFCNRHWERGWDAS